MTDKTTGKQPLFRLVEKDSRIVKWYYWGMEWMTIKETAKYLRVSVSTIRKFVKTGTLPSYQQGHLIRLKQLDIDAFLTLNIIKPEKSK